MQVGSLSAASHASRAASLALGDKLLQVIAPAVKTHGGLRPQPLTGFFYDGEYQLLLRRRQGDCRMPHDN